MSSARPGAKASPADKNFEAQKLRMLERAEKNFAKKNEKERELEPWEKARIKLKEMCTAEPHERDLNELSQGLLFIADQGKESHLEEMVHRRFPVLITEHFKNSLTCSNVLYCIGTCAQASFEKKLLPPAKEREDGIHGTSGVDVSAIEFVPLNPDKHLNPILLRKLVIQQKERLTALIEEVFHKEDTDLNDVWFATVVSVIAVIRAHQPDSLVMSNGIFALGRLAQSAVGLKFLVSKIRGIETIVNAMALHDHDNIIASNGCLAIARICHLPVIADTEDRDIAFLLIDQNSAVQEKALQEGALQSIFQAESKHSSDPVVERAFAEAVGGLCVANNHLAIEELKEAASRICKAMDHNYHEIGAKAIQFSIFDEEHGRDEFVTAYGCKSFGSMVLEKSTHKAAGQDRRFPYLVGNPDKQDAIADVGAIQCMCMALKQFPKKKDTVLTLCSQAVAHVIRRNEKTQRLFVKHKGVDYIMALMTKWEEDHEFFMCLLRTLRVLLEGSDGIRNYWYLDTNKGRDVGKFVVKTYATEAKEFGTLADIKDAQEMAAQWLPEKKKESAPSNVRFAE